MNDTADAMVTVLWNAIIVLGCAYLVFWRGESGWWFALVPFLVWRTDKNAMHEREMNAKCKCDKSS